MAIYAEIDVIILRIPFYWCRLEEKDLSMKLVGGYKFIYI